jgi:meiosis induction protein kinase IME2/SME1
LLDEALMSTHKAVKRMDRNQYSEVLTKDTRQPLRQSTSNMALTNPYPTPSPSANGNTVLFGQGVPNAVGKPRESNKLGDNVDSYYKGPTPPYEENEWAESAAASIWAAGNRF